MASIKDQVQTALDETRMLLIASQVFFGFEFRGIFEPGFRELPQATQYLKLAGLGLTILMIALLLTNAAWHRIVEGGEDRRRVVRVATVTVEPALIAFAIVLSIDSYMAAGRTLGQGYAAPAGALTALICFAGFQGLRFATRGHRRRHQEDEMKHASEETPEKPTEVKDRIRHLLTETRVVIPGAQVLLGFQYSIILMEAFTHFSELSKRVHLFSIACTTLAIVLLIAPAAYHRVVERGALTEHFHRIGTRFVVAGLVPLSLGLSAEVYVATNYALSNHTFAVGSAIATLVVTSALWFGLTSVARLARGHRAGMRERQPA